MMMTFQATKFELETVIAGCRVDEYGMLTRDGWTLDWRGERQALPSGSSPLKAGDGPAIDGQGWTASEVERYAEVIGGFCVFEREIR